MEVEERLIKKGYLLVVGLVMYIPGKCEIRNSYSYESIYHRSADAEAAHLQCDRRKKDEDVYTIADRGWEVYTIFQFLVPVSSRPGCNSAAGFREIPL